MKIEHHIKSKRYTLSNDNIKNGDLVYPIANGRCLDDGSWILHSFYWTEFMFPNEPHRVINTKHGTYKPYQIRTDHGYGPIEKYYKIIKVEEQVKKGESRFGASYHWIDITESELKTIKSKNDE